MINPQLQQALQNILMQRKQTYGGAMDTSLPQMPNAQTQAPSMTMNHDGLMQTAQSLSNLMGYGKDTTFGYQMPNQTTGDANTAPQGQQMGNFSQMKPIDFLKFMAGGLGL